MKIQWVSRQLSSTLNLGDNIYAIEEYLIDQCDFFHYNSNDPHNNIEAKLSDISDGRLYFMLTASSLNTRNKTKYLTILHHEELEYYLNVQKSVVIPSKRIIRLLKLKELNIND